ncbi:putative mitochondrial outer membrane protein YPR098C [Colletotrichum liriopes]|uniref:Mitochondrial outer membrane protein YPR098C n=1 Tax=Colletotrichum liriopes TaxID=708192 RepID=A0AA37LMS6_9PEZI|nr:putative mitochondrial outer membrane protein YPR098C [Colletotrichum liriopes]
MAISLPAFMTNLAPYHIISYATLLGTSLFQTFVNTKICYNELPRSAFTTLQKRLFPVYFRCQAALLLLTAITFPPYGPPSLLKEKRDWIPLAFVGLTAMANLFIYGPKTRQAMIDRVHQETRDAKRPDAVDEPSPDMHAVKRRFSFSHAMSIHLNLIGIFGMVWYGVRLASKLNIDMD